VRTLANDRSWPDLAARSRASDFQIAAARGTVLLHRSSLEDQHQLNWREPAELNIKSKKDLRFAGPLA